MREILQQALELLIAYQDHTGDFRIANKCGSTIQALEAELAKPEPRNDAAWHWHDLYKAKCQEFHDKQAALGTEIVALEEDLAELKEEQLAEPEQEPQMIQIKDGHLSYIKKPWVGLTDDEINDFDKKLRDNGDYCSLHFAWGISAKLKEKNAI